MLSIEKIDVDKVLAGLKEAAATATNEEELRIKDSNILENEVISMLGISCGRYEYTFASGGRSDALYGHVIIEYKGPGKLSKKSDIAKAKERLIGYIKKHAETEDKFKLFLGVLLADKIAFVCYDTRTKSWLIRGPYELARETVLRLVEALRGLRKKKLVVKHILKDFGPKSSCSAQTVKTLYQKLITSNNPKVKALFNDWKRLFSQACAYSPEKLKGLETDYRIRGSVEYSALLFAIHTYYALLMKLLAAEVAYLYGTGKWLKSYVAELEKAYLNGLPALKEALKDLESGGVFRKLLNITNFIEGNYFLWYLEVLDQNVANVISEVAKILADYEPATPMLEPKYTRDLLKRLYQNLVPKKIRHDLGEYYTPDWLAELLLNEVQLTSKKIEAIAKEKRNLLAPLNLRVLDPACGSGTFLVLAIKRFKEYAEKHYLRDKLASYMLKNVVGFDLNPLAVLTARTNYLLAIADMLGHARGPIEIPIYLADSLLVETKNTLVGQMYVIRTYVDQFEIPKSLVVKGLQGRVLEAVDRCVRQKYTTEEFKERTKIELKLDQNELNLVGNLYQTFLKLEREGKNHVWTSVIRNAFAPLTIISSYGKFDYVVGNPPWVNWENLPKNYRNISTPLWDKYQLKAKATAKQFELGKMRRDISTLFLYVCSDQYLQNNGTFGFLITQMVFKTKGAEVFRRFKLRDGTEIKVLKVHDMIKLKPFEEAANMTSMIILRKGEHTTYPIPYIRWAKLRKGDLTNATLGEAHAICSKDKLIAIPVDPKDSTSQWLTVEKKIAEILTKLRGASTYKAHAGVYTGGANGVFWVRILDKQPSGNLLIENLYDAGKQKLKKMRELVEPTHVYGLIRSGDLQKWLPTPKYNVIIPHTEQTDWRAIAEHKMKVGTPKTYEYFWGFKEILLKRSAYTSLRKGHPFYIMIDIRKNSFSPFKVAWKRMGNEINAVVLSSFDDPCIGKKSLIPQETISFVPFKNGNEAHYLCGLLNSRVVNFFIKSFSQFGGKSFATPSILRQINIPRYDATNKVHQRLVQSSKKAHELALMGIEEKLAEVENDIDNCVAQLYGLTKENLKEIKNP